MKYNLIFNRIAFIISLALCTSIGGLIHQNVINNNYIWLIGDFIILIMLYISVYYYAQHIDKE